MCKYWFVRATHITAKSTNLDISVHLNRYVLNVTCCLVTIIVICLLFKLFTLLDRNQIWKLLVSGEALKKAMCRNREVCGRKGQRSISDRTISETNSAVRRREALSYLDTDGDYDEWELSCVPGSPVCDIRSAKSAVSICMCVISIQHLFQVAVFNSSFLSDEGPTLKMWDFAFHIGSTLYTKLFIYFDLYNSLKYKKVGVLPIRIVV